MVVESRILDHWNSLLQAEPAAPVLRAPEGATITREDLERRSREVAKTLMNGGLKAGQVLLVCLPNGPEWLAVFIGAFRCGVVVVFADPSTSRSELLAYAGSMKASAVWSLEGLSLQVSEEPVFLGNHGLVLGKLTSGSTGDPKCLYFTDKEMLADGRLTAGAFGYKNGDRVLGLVPWGHSYGLGAIIMPLFLYSLEVSGLESPLPTVIEETCRRMRPTVFPAVPTVIRALVRSDCSEEAFRSIRLLLTAGSRLDPEIATAFYGQYGIAPRNLYGSSETGSVTCDATGEATLTGRSVGRVIDGVKVWRDENDRLHVESPAVFTFGNRAIAASGRGCHVMGDHGYVSDSNEVVISSRAKGFVKVGEKRVGLAEVEKRLTELADVSNAVAIAFEYESDTVVGAILESDSERKVLAKAMRASIPARYRPKVWEAVDSLPVTDRGKVSMRKIRDILKGRQSGSSTTGSR